jgi:hypothetical protein
VKLALSKPDKSIFRSPQFIMLKDNVNLATVSWYDEVTTALSHPCKIHERRQPMLASERSTGQDVRNDLALHWLNTKLGSA